MHSWLQNFFSSEKWRHFLRLIHFIKKISTSLSIKVQYLTSFVKKKKQNEWDFIFFFFWSNSNYETSLLFNSHTGAFPKFARKKKFSVVVLVMNLLNKIPSNYITFLLIHESKNVAKKKNHNQNSNTKTTLNVICQSER